MIIIMTMITFDNPELVTKAAVNTEVDVSLLVLVSSGCMHSSGIAGSLPYIFIPTPSQHLLK